MKHSLIKLDNSNLLLLKKKKQFVRHGGEKIWVSPKHYLKHIQDVQQVLTSINKTQNIFTFPKLMSFKPPDYFGFSFDKNSVPLNVTEIYNLAKHDTRNDSPHACLYALANSFLKQDPFPLKTNSILPDIVNDLKYISLDSFANLTKPQKKYLAPIHQNTQLQDALRPITSQSSPKSFIHGDFRFANILKTKGSGNLLHIIDWEFAGLGPRVFDWVTLCLDYILAYLTHYIETKSKTTALQWQDIENLMRSQLKWLHELYKNNRTGLAKEYLQWLGILLLLKGMHIMHQYVFGEELSQLIFQTGRRFLLEYDQLQNRLKTF